MFEKSKSTSGQVTHKVRAMERIPTYGCASLGYNRPLFLSSCVPLFQNESKCETFHMKTSSACSFIFMQISHFHKNGFTLKLTLKQRFKGTPKWLIKAEMEIIHKVWL